MTMPADLLEKTRRYEGLLADALEAADPVIPPESPLGSVAADFESMAESYLADGRHFLEAGLARLEEFDGGSWRPSGRRGTALHLPPPCRHASSALPSPTSCRRTPSVGSRKRLRASSTGWPRQKGWTGRRRGGRRGSWLPSPERRW